MPKICELTEEEKKIQYPLTKAKYNYKIPSKFHLRKMRFFFTDCLFKRKYFAKIFKAHLDGMREAGADEQMIREEQHRMYNEGQLVVDFALFHSYNKKVNSWHKHLWKTHSKETHNMYKEGTSNAVGCDKITLHEAMLESVEKLMDTYLEKEPPEKPSPAKTFNYKNFELRPKKEEV